MGIRLCWLATCACRRTPTDRTRTCSAVHYKYDGVDPRHLFEDHASGTKDHRTGLARSLAAAPARDRDLAQGHRVAFRFVTENLDPQRARANSCSSCSALAQYERALIQERVASHLRTFALPRASNSRSTFSSIKYAATESGAAQPRRPRLRHPTQGPLVCQRPIQIQGDRHSRLGYGLAYLIAAST